MFDNHQPCISRYARSGPDALARVMQFVVLTVRTPLYNVKADIETAQAGGPEAMRVLFGWKHEAFYTVWEKRRELFETLESIWHPDPKRFYVTEGHVRMLQAVCAIPGFGPVKAGFVLQLAYGISGCLDTHNLRRFNLPKGAFAGYKARTGKGKLAMLRRYVRALHKVTNTSRYGDPTAPTRALWDTWCEYVYSRQPAKYANASAVSWEHCRALGVSPDVPF